MTKSGESFDERRASRRSDLSSLVVESARSPVEVRLTDRQLRDLTDSLPHLVWTCVPEGPCDYLSRQWVEYTGIHEEEQLGYGWLAQIHPEDRARVQEQWRSTVGLGAAFDIEFRIRRADGVYRWFRTRAIPLHDSSGTITKWYGSNTDIDESKRVEASLKLSEARLRLAQHVADVGAFEWNIQTGARTWTPELERIHGIDPSAYGETPASTFEELIHPDDRQIAARLHEAALTSAAPVEGEWRIELADGTTRWLFARFQMFRDEYGAPERIVGVNVDITSRKRAEQEVRRLNENLERLVDERTKQLSVANRELSAANRELEAFSYSVAHDLRAPLRGMSGFAAILAEEWQGEIDDKSARYLRMILENAGLMGRLIDALLALSRVSRTELQLVPVDVSARARASVEALRRGEPDRTVEVVIEEDLRAELDPTLASMLLDNLVGNAWKFTSKSAEPRIHVGASSERGGRTFFVRDNGAGFDMAHANKLFTPFQRLHAPREFTGTGIGLATAHRIVARHGGQLWAEGKVGGGATFYFRLPQREPA